MSRSIFVFHSDLSSRRSNFYAFFGSVFVPGVLVAAEGWQLLNCSWNLHSTVSWASRFQHKNHETPTRKTLAIMSLAYTQVNTLLVIQILVTSKWGQTTGKFKLQNVAMIRWEIFFVQAKLFLFYGDNLPNSWHENKCWECGAVWLSGLVHACLAWVRSSILANQIWAICC